MRPATLPRILAALLVGAACGLSQAATPVAEQIGTPGEAEPVLQLQLADGSVVHVPSDAVDKRADAPALTERTGAMRRAAPRARIHVFDAERPGAIASVRG